jgi:hypothetical protein
MSQRRGIALRQDVRDERAPGASGGRWGLETGATVREVIAHLHHGLLANWRAMGPRPPSVLDCAE